MAIFQGKGISFSGLCAKCGIAAYFLLLQIPATKCYHILQLIHIKRNVIRKASNSGVGPQIGISLENRNK